MSTPSARRAVPRRPAWIAAALLALAACRTPATRVAEPAEPAEPGEATAVRAARARFNDAIARHDSAAIAPLLMASYHIVTGRSVQTHGREAALASWGALFRGDSTLRYLRAPREVRVNAAWGLAEELGDWTGRLTAPDGAVRVRGSYAAKWQRAGDGRWLLQSETFTTLACDGGARGCVPPDPVAP